VDGEVGVQVDEEWQKEALCDGLHGMMTNTKDNDTMKIKNKILKVKFGLFFLLCLSSSVLSTEPTMRKIFLINTTDLYFPGQDLGDNFDIIAAYALEEVDLRAVIFDVTEKYRLERGVGRDMGIVPITQLNYIFDRTVPALPSPFIQMRSTTDKMEDIPKFQQAGVELLLKTLRESKEKVDITVFGSARTVAVAFNRNPDLLRKKVNLLHLSIGTSAPVQVEWNVALDPHAFVAVLQSGLPIALYPCGAGNLDGGWAAFSYDSNNGYWELANLNFVPEMDPPIRRYLEFAFSGSKRPDFLRAMETDDPLFDSNCWNKMHRVWETCVWICMTDRVLVQRNDGSHRILRRNELEPTDRILPNELRPCILDVQENGLFTYRYTDQPSNIRIYYRGDPKENEKALNDALPALYLEFKTK